MKLFSILVCTLTLTSCTITMMNTSTSGKAQDSVDADSNASPTISPETHVTPI